MTEATSISVNIGFLGFFKYFNFFAESFRDAFTFLGTPISDPILLNVILPVGISFYTFQTLASVIVSVSFGHSRNSSFELNALKPCPAWMTPY
jgi:D-alanyl-lipoteichoic acid acyltransferase DltB (MBOAT superfamily)